MRRLLAVVFVILALSAVSNVYAGELSVTKCTVTAGKTEGYGTIVVSGTMNATADDLSAASSIEVTIDSDDMVSPCVQSFPINENSFKRSKGKYNYARTENASKTSFKFDTKTGKFSFTAKNVDLSGLGCPLTIEIEIGDYICTAEVDETIVNGTKKPIPIKLMMRVKDVLRVDKCTVKYGTKSNSDQLTVKGVFAVEDTTVNMANEEFVVTLDSQTFTLSAGSFIAKTGQFTCKKIAPTEGEGGVASATFNFTKCSFTITIKNMTITAGSGAVDFCVAFAGYSQCVQVTLPTAPTRCTFTISPTAESFTAGGGDGSVTVTTSNGCAWTATSHASWIIITSGSSGSGSGTVGYSVAANGGTAERTGTMTISGHTFTVTQAKPTADIPSAPTGVTASAGDGQVSISWNAVSGATSYNIYWSTTSGVTKTNGTKITDATSPYSHTGLTNGTTYYYIVTAVNSSGESVESAQVSATPTAVQDPPIKLFNAGVSPWINDIMEDSSNNILVAGTQDDSWSIVVLKLSSAGTQVWNKYFPAGTTVVLNNVFEVPSQGYLLTGSIYSTLGSLFKMPIDPDGTNSSPSYFFPDCGYPYWASGPSSNDSVRLSDGSVIFAGAADFENNCGIGIDYGNAVITGINSSGTQYFWSDYDYAPGYSETFNSVIALSGGGFAAAGEADLYDNGDGYGGPYNAILVKTNAAGSVIWTQNYGYKTDDLHDSGVLDLIQTSDNGYAMLAWLGYDYSMYVIKTDSSGNSTSEFNAATGDSCYQGRKFVQSGDNGFVIVGQGSGCAGAVVKMSAAGVKVWEYNTDYNPTAIVKSASGGYLIAGDANPDMGVYKIFVFKLDDLGKRVW